MNQFLNCDCMEFMISVPDKFFELAIVDPPYGILPTDRSLKGAGKLKNRAINKFQTEWDIAPNENYFNELFRISKNQIIWGGNYYNLGRTRGFIIWDKCQPWPNFSQCEFAWTNFDKPAKIFVFDNKRDRETRIHPTQKPIQLYRWLLQNYAKPGDKIFDSHAGSASSLIACHLEGFEYIGCELDPDYYREAKQRLDAYKKLHAQTLFKKSGEKFIKNERIFQRRKNQKRHP